ncbi:MAG TPA: GntR family transcriptional regulator [Vicinamibacterales bacterium]|nr:GntR family transcriptional regulator [Vicinamibacterales bacterium]
MALISIDARDTTPIYAQIEHALRAAIASGRLRTGDQLPTVRELAVDLAVNANTVARVYTDLERSGVIETRRGVGSFVAITRDRVRTSETKLRQLTTFATRVLADADRHGFTLDEVLTALKAHKKGA